MPDEAKHTILCVDDEPDVVDTLFDTFMDLYDVKTATSGEDALKIMQTEDVVLVISDQRMPEMEGTELLAKINELKPICKKILLTGYADITAAIDAINKGSVDRYFGKPWDEEELITAAHDLLAMYDTDAFLAKVMKGARSMKEKIGDLPKSLSTYMDNCLMGVCVVGPGEKIEYLNPKALEILKVKNADDVKGKGYRDVFLLTDADKEAFWQRYFKKDPSLESLNVKSGDDSDDKVQAGLTFVVGAKGIEVCGITFEASPDP